MKAFLSAPLALVALAGQAYAAVSVFMTVTDATDGSNLVVEASTTTLVKNAIEIQSWSYGVENTVNLNSQSAGAGAGKISFDRFSLMKNVDGSTGAFFTRMAQGKSQTINIFFFKSTGAAGAGTKAPYMTMQFRQAAFTSQQLSGTDGGDVPQEALQFAYGAMQISYATQSPSGSLSTPVTSGWNSIRNTPEVSAVPKTS